MSEVKEQNNTTETQETTNAPAASSANAGQGGFGGRGERTRNPRRGRGRGPRQTPRSEFDQRMLAIRRVARVSAGGRRFNFSVAIVIGNKKGGVGVGVGKAGDTSAAINKAVNDAKKNMITISLTGNKSIAHEVAAKYCSARILVKPSAGRGLVAGSAVRDVLELAGITDVNGKIISGSKNKLNIARAAIDALATLKRAKLEAKAEKTA